MGRLTAIVAVATGLAAGSVVACGSSSTESAPSARTGPVPCKDLAACTAACAPCRTGRCSQREGWQCMRLGKLRLSGEPPQFDVAEAALIYEAGCKSYAPACAALALQVQDGRGVPYDARRAMALYQDACDRSAGIGCFNLALMYDGGVGVARDTAKAHELYRKAETLYVDECKVDPSWCTNLGYLYENALVGPRDDARAVRLFRDACDRGALDSCGSLANHLLEGTGVAADKPGAIALMERTCTAGNALTCSNLAATLDRDGPSPRAGELYAQACKGGGYDSAFSYACAYLASMYERGVLHSADPTYANQLFDRACDLGHSLACMARGSDLRDAAPADAARRFARACHIGDARGCMEYAGLIERGAVAGDTHEWTAEACRQGMPEACNLPP